MKRLALAVALCTMAASPARAIEGGLSPYPKGMADFLSGILPPEPGFYVADIYYYLHGSAEAAVRNGRVEFGVDVTMNADFLRGTYVSDLQLLGGTYAASAAFAYANAGIDANLVGPNAAVDFSLGTTGWADSIVSPVILGWHDGNFHWNLALNVYVPTGDYDVGGFNLGKNVWGFMPAYSLTWFDPAIGWDVSGSLVYVTMDRNAATDYQSGDLIDLDWAIGKHFGPGLAWTVGVAGNVVQQVGADSGSGARLGPFKAESWGLGPAITYMGKAGSIQMVFNAKWEHDLASNNTFGGDVASFSVTASF